MKLSVVMTTYNAGSYLEAQLDSLRTQLLPPDEILILDDCSTDDTRARVECYLRRYELGHWRLITRSENVGWKRNFMEGLRMAQGEYIFPCDQDDIWYPEKLRDMIQVMEAHPEICLLACDYAPVYETGALQANVYPKSKAERTGLVCHYRFTTHFMYNRNPGCSYCVRKRFFEEVDQLWFDAAPYDEFLWVFSTVRDGTFFMNRILMDYRRHAGNASYIRSKDIELQLENLAYMRALLDRLNGYFLTHPEQLPPDRMQHIEAATRWCEKRVRLMQTRNPLRWLAMAPQWYYYNNPKNCLGDLWLVLFGSFEHRAMKL